MAHPLLLLEGGVFLTGDHLSSLINLSDMSAS